MGGARYPVVVLHIVFFGGGKAELCLIVRGMVGWQYLITYVVLSQS